MSCPENKAQRPGALKMLSQGRKGPNGEGTRLLVPSIPSPRVGEASLCQGTEFRAAGDGGDGSTHGTAGPSCPLRAAPVPLPGQDVARGEEPGSLQGTPCCGYVQDPVLGADLLKTIYLI